MCCPTSLDCKTLPSNHVQLFIPFFNSPASYETLDGVLRHDRRRVPVLLDYVRYPHNPAIQVGSTLET